MAAAAAILRKLAIEELRESERNVVAEGSSCCPDSAAHLEKERASSGRCRMNRSGRLNVEEILPLSGRQ